MANPQNVTTDEDTTVPITLTGDDGDPEVTQTLTFALGSGPSHGELSGTTPNLTYTPDGGYSGPDSFTFTVTDDAAAGGGFVLSTADQTPRDTPDENIIAMQHVAETYGKY